MVRGGKAPPGRAAGAAGRGAQTESPSSTTAGAAGPAEIVRNTRRRAASAETAAEPRRGKGLAPSLTATLWPSWALNLGPDGFPRCAEPNRRAGLN